MGTLKDLIKYFYEYPMEFFPVVARNNSIIGFISKKSSLKDVNDVAELKINIADFIINNLVKYNPENSNEYLKKLQKFSKYPVVYTDGEIEVFNDSDFQKLFVRADKISYKNILNKSRIGVLIFDTDALLLFKNNYLDILIKQGSNFNIEEFISNIILNINNDGDSHSCTLIVDFEGVEIPYYVSSFIDDDRDFGNKVIISYFIPKADLVIKNNLKISNNKSDNSENNLKKFLKDEIIEKINEENFSLKEYISEKEKILIETLSEILDNNINLISKVLKINKEDVEFKIKQYKIY